MRATIKCYDKIKSLNNKIIRSLNNFEYKGLAKLFDTHWNFKKKLEERLVIRKLIECMEI